MYFLYTLLCVTGSKVNLNMTFIGRYNTHYVMLMDTVTAYKSGFMGKTAYLYTPLVWECSMLAESKLNLTLSAVQGHLIDGPAAKTKLKVRMVSNELKDGNDNAVQRLVVDVDVHDRTSKMLPY